MNEKGKLAIGEGRLQNERTREETRRLAQQTTDRRVTSQIDKANAEIKLLEERARHFGPSQEIKDRLEIARADKANAEAALADARNDYDRDGL